MPSQKLRLEAEMKDSASPAIRKLRQELADLQAVSAETRGTTKLNAELAQLRTGAAVDGSAAVRKLRGELADLQKATAENRAISGLNKEIAALKKQSGEIAPTAGMKGFSSWMGEAKTAATGVMGAIEGVAGFLGPIGIGAIVASQSVSKLASEIKELGEQSLAMKEMSRETGISIDFLNRWSHSGEHFAVSGDAMRGMLDRFTSQLPDFNRGVGGMYKEFSQWPDVIRRMQHEGPAEALIDAFRQAEEVGRTKGPLVRKQFLDAIGIGGEAEKLFADHGLSGLFEQLNKSYASPSPGLLKEAQALRDAGIGLNNDFEKLENQVAPGFLKVLSTGINGIDLLVKGWVWEFRAIADIWERLSKAVKPGAEGFDENEKRTLPDPPANPPPPTFESPEDLRHRQDHQTFGLMGKKASYDGAGFGDLRRNASFTTGADPTASSQFGLSGIMAESTKAGVLAAFREWAVQSDADKAIGKGGFSNASYEGGRIGGGGGFGGGGGGGVDGLGDAGAGAGSGPADRGLSGSGHGRRGFMTGGGDHGSVPAAPAPHDSEDIVGGSNLMSGGHYAGAVPGQDLTTITTASGKRLTVHKDAAPSFKRFIDQLEARGYKVDSLGGYANRANRSDGSRPSEHAFGNAIDINPDRNPFRSDKTDLPADISRLAAENGLSWGGDWRHKDNMHFEWRGKRPWETNGPIAQGGSSDPAAPQTNARLAAQRKVMFDELDRDAALRKKVLQVAAGENNGSAKSLTTVVESMANRAAMRGQKSFADVLGLRDPRHSFYSGIKDGDDLRRRLSAQELSQGEEAIKAARDGSNLIGYRTDQGMPTDPTARRVYMVNEASKKKYGAKEIEGEHYYYSVGGGIEFAKHQEELDRKYAADHKAALASIGEKPTKEDLNRANEEAYRSRQNPFLGRSAANLDDKPHPNAGRRATGLSDAARERQQDGSEHRLTIALHDPGGSVKSTRIERNGPLRVEMPNHWQTGRNPLIGA